MPGMIKGKHLKYWVNRHDSKVVYIKYLLLLINGTEMTNCLEKLFLPARASEQGNVIGSVRIYIYTLLLLLLTGPIFSYFCMSSITSVPILAILIAIVLF